MLFFHTIRNTLLKHNLQNALQVVSHLKYSHILRQIIIKHTTSLNPSLMAKELWLWEFFKAPTFVINREEPLDLLEMLCPNNIEYYCLIEDWGRTKKQDNYWLLKGNITSIIRLLNELWAVEFYITPLNMQWILCKNHHSCLIGSGEYMYKRLKQLSKEIT